MAQVRHVVAIEIDDKNVFWCCAGRKEVVEKEFAEQIRFPASPQTRDDLDLAIPCGAKCDGAVPEKRGSTKKIFRFTEFFPF